MSQKIVQVDAFTNQPFKGNPAAVCIMENEAEVVTFPFRNYSDNLLEMEGISYYHFDKDSLLLTVEVHKKDGTAAMKK